MTTQAQRKHVRCQAYRLDSRLQCSNVATGHIRLPAKLFVCAECRQRWEACHAGMIFNDRLEQMPESEVAA